VADEDEDEPCARAEKKFKIDSVCGVGMASTDDSGPSLAVEPRVPEEMQLFHGVSCARFAALISRGGICRLVSLTTCTRRSGELTVMEGGSKTGGSLKGVV
jgi:hypothetical protein